MLGEHSAYGTMGPEAHGLHVGGKGSYLLGWCRLRDGSRVELPSRSPS